MSAIEGFVVVALVVAATVASVLGGLTPALAGIIGTALGYAGGRVATLSPSPINAGTETPWKGSD